MHKDHSDHKGVEIMALVSRRPSTVLQKTPSAPKTGPNPVSGDKGHLIHLTILVQFSLCVHKSGLRS